MPIQNEGSATRGWIFYDAGCVACVACRNRTGRLFESRGFRWVPLQTPGAAEWLGVSETAFATRMHLLSADGAVRHNADAFGVLCRSVCWLWPVGVLLLVPGFRELGQLTYEWIARNRHCFGGKCRVPETRSADFQIGSSHAKRCPSRIGNRRSLSWLPLVLLPSTIISLRGELLPWVFMWLLAFAIYAGCKWLTYEDALASGVRAPFRSRLTYLLLWPGMSFKEFVGTPLTVREPARWLAPAAKTLVGATLVWFAVPVVPADAELLRGWVGMIGLIMMLHFGTFHLLALTLQAAGFSARPNMNAPLLARSLADFWGRRWNTGFSVLADRYGFRPLTPRFGPRAGLVIVFLASGLIHDLVIWFPAGGGFGLPTLYFALQAVGLFVERTPLIRRRPWLNRLFAWLVLLVPLGCLLPPVFVRNIILPMLNAIGAN